MYFVYRLTFGERCYIGCTSDLVRRKQQHNENARKGKSKLGRFLRDNNIILSNSDFETLCAFQRRSDALCAERETALKLSSDGVDLLNDNYSRDCTRKGKNLGNTAKHYVVVDFANHTVADVFDLRQYCIENGMDYKLVQRTVAPGKKTESGIKAFYYEEWNRISDKEFYISGAFVAKAKQKSAEAKAEKTSKTYEVLFPDGHSELVKNLDKFAREHGLTSGTLHATFTKSKPTKGYQVIRRI